MPQYGGRSQYFFLPQHAADLYDGPVAFHVASGKNVPGRLEPLAGECASSHPLRKCRLHEWASSIGGPQRKPGFWESNMSRLNARGLILSALAANLLAMTAVGQSALPPTAAGSRHVPEAVSTGPDFGAKLHPALLQRFAEDADADAVKTWVFFTDKNLPTREAVEAAVEDVARTYDERAAERRGRRGLAARRGEPIFNEHDVPVPTVYVEGVRATGARVHITSRWLNAVSVWATREQAHAIAALPFVDRLEAVARVRRIDPLDPDPASDGATPPTYTARGRVDYGESGPQLEQINLPALHAAGYTGQGVVVGILDTGFERSHEAFNFGLHKLTVLAEYDFLDDDGDTSYEEGDPSDQHRHGTLILGCLGAYKPGALVGGAYDAAFVLAKTEDTTGEYPAEEDNYVAGLEFLEGHGVDVTTSSLGYIDWYTQSQLDGQTAVTTIAINILTSLGVHHCNAAGNEYHDSNPSTSSLIAPADGFQVITCGAVESSGSIASFSSDGPTADGRVKPEVVALGSGTHTVDPFSTTGFTTASGTSLSTPLVACAVACLVEARPYWTVDQMRQHLFETAGYYVEHGTYDPAYVYGYGLVNAFAAYQGCNDAGSVALDDTVYRCGSVLSIVVADCGLNTDDLAAETVTIAIDSTSESGVEQVTLSETAGDSAEFVGSIAISTTDNPGVLWAVDGDVITATYIDADDGEGGYGVVVTATASVDCSAAAISGVRAENIGATSADVTFDADEPVKATVFYGLSCDALTNQVVASEFSVAPVVSLAGLTQDTTYYYAVQGEDAAGNTTYDNHDGMCYALRTAPGPQVIYSFPLDSNPGWTTAGEWAFGQPSGQGGTAHGDPDPSSGATGANVYGINLGGDWSTSTGGPWYVTTGEIDLTGAAEVSLRYQRWINSDWQPYAVLTIEVSHDGITWTTVWANGDSEMTASAWSAHEYDMSGVADDQPAVRVRWGYAIDTGVWAYSGWNFDDVEVWGVVAPALCAGDLDCDGSVTYADIDLFVAALNHAGGIGWSYDCPWLNGDCDGDGDVNYGDIDPFVGRIGATCP